MIIKLDRTGFKRRIWERAFKRALQAYSDSIDNVSLDEKETVFMRGREQIVFYGIKVYGSWQRKVKHPSSELLENQFYLNETILDGMKYITPRQFMGWFPIAKTYDGERWEMKDYFHTMDYINSVGIDEPIKEPMEFLWEYVNDDTRNFLINHTCVMSDIRKQETGMGIMEEYLLDNGIEPFYE